MIRADRVVRFLVVLLSCTLSLVPVRSLAGDTTPLGDVLSHDGFETTVTPTVESIVVAPSAVVVAIAQVEPLVAWARYDDRIDRVVTNSAQWSSANAAIAAVSNAAGQQGNVSAVSVGNTTIAATFDALSGSATVDSVECLIAAHCPDSGSECALRACNNQFCGLEYEVFGTLLAQQTNGDCRNAVCDGAGGTTFVPVDSDLPNDGNECTTDGCTSGSPTFFPVATGTACSSNGGQVCDESGNCVECVDVMQCPPPTNECSFPVCNAGVCGADFAAFGAPANQQTSGDCQLLVCDGAGEFTSISDDVDLPDDGNQCTDDLCSDGVPLNTYLAAGTPCAQDGGTQCDGAGQCMP